MWRAMADAADARAGAAAVRADSMAGAADAAVAGGAADVAGADAAVTLPPPPSPAGPAVGGGGVAWDALWAEQRSPHHEHTVAFTLSDLVQRHGPPRRGPSELFARPGAAYWRPARVLALLLGVVTEPSPCP